MFSSFFRRYLEEQLLKQHLHDERSEINDNKTVTVAAKILPKNQRKILTEFQEPLRLLPHNKKIRNN